MKNNSVIEFPNVSVKKQNRYAVILAGGDGSRLKSLTRVISGDDRPKQFCPILQGETLLDVTRRRVQLKVSAENIFFSLTAKHKSFYEPLLKGVSPKHQIVQPQNKGTAPAILYSLLHLQKIDLQATVVFCPSDHYFSDDSAFMKNVETGFQAIELIPESIILLGIEPESAETSYGWIEPQETLFGSFSGAVSNVKRFWEKPTIEIAQSLMSKGCLWNSFVMIGKVEMFLSLIEKHLPEIYRIFNSASQSIGTSSEMKIINSIYAWINEINFSSEVLERSTKELSVMRVDKVSWSDLGEPQRVIGTLANLGLQPNWGFAYVCSIQLKQLRKM